MTASMLAVDDKTLIPDLLRVAPQARIVLDRYGLRGCGGSEAPRESLRFFARAHDVPLDRLLRELSDSTSVAIAPPADLSAASSLADGIYRPFFVAGIATVLTLIFLPALYATWYRVREPDATAAG